MDATERKEPIDVSTWKSRRGPKPVTLPGGEIVMVVKRGLEVMWRVGLIPNSLVNKVRQVIVTGKGLEPNDEWQNEELQGLLGLIDNMVVFCVVNPKIHPAPTNEKDRSDSAIYVDEWDMDEKMAVFDYVTGVDEAESFRDESSSDVDDVSNEQSVEDTTVEPALD